MLSGVGLLDLKGTTSSSWLRTTTKILPDMFTPLNHAITEYSIPVPLVLPGSTTYPVFRVEQWSPFVGLSSMYNQNHSINSGFAVDTWRPHPFRTVKNASTGQMIDKIFSGISVDVAVRDSDAWLHRLSYKITLLGRIIFAEIPIID